VTVYGVDLQGQHSPAVVNELRDPNPLWIEVRPGLRRIHTLAGDILIALGKRRDVAGVGRNEHEDVDHAIAWMRAHEVTALVVDAAERLHPLILANLIRQMDRAEIPLWLLHRPPRSDSFMRKIDRLTTARTLTDLPQPQPTTTEMPPARCAGDLPRPFATTLTLPDTDFLFFMAACRRALSAEDAAVVEQQLASSVRQADATLSAHGATTATVAKVMQELLNPAPHDPELITRVRGLQIAAWHHDLYMQVDLQRLLNSEERPRLTAAAAEECLTVYRQPYRAITPVLTMAGLGVEDISTLPIRATCLTGTSVRVGQDRIELGERTARAVRAQLHLRGHAGPDAPLLPHTPKALAKALTEAAVDVGVHVHGRRAERTRDHSRSNLRALGITVARLS
jgi:hypothetical protein